MHIITVGLNYKTAPVEIREKVSFELDQLPEAMKALQTKKSVLENIIVSTCNRTEVYAVVDQLHTGRYYIKEFLSEWFSIDLAELSSYLYIYEEDGAVNHLFQVACGLNSMVLGETQILGQVKKSFMLAQVENTTGVLFWAEAPLRRKRKTRQPKNKMTMAAAKTGLTRRSIKPKLCCIRLLLTSSLFTFTFSFKYGAVLVSTGVVRPE